MTPHAHTEDQLVEQPAMGLFAALGRQTVLAWKGDTATRLVEGTA
jgi:hypothetical protein